MVETETGADVLAVLLFNANMVKRADLDEAMTIASQLGMTVDRALIMSGVASEEVLKPSVAVADRVRTGKLTLDMGVKALRLAIQNRMTIDEAVRALSKVHTKTSVLVPATNELSSILLAARIITSEQLGQTIRRAADTGMMLGQVLLIERLVSLGVLYAALNALFLMRDSNLDHDRAVQGLRYANQREISIEQSLFELQFFTQPSALSLRVGELFELGGIISRSNMVECLEIEFFKQKPFGQILLEQGLVTHEQLEAAILLQNGVANELIKAYQAAEALRRVCRENIPVYQAQAEVMATFDPLGKELRLGELMIQADVCSRQMIESVIQEPTESNIKLGKRLLIAGVVKEAGLYAALRCQSLWRMGYLSGAQAVRALSHVHRSELSLDATLAELGLNVPSRMQWSWV